MEELSNKTTMIVVRIIMWPKFFSFDRERTRVYTFS